MVSLFVGVSVASAYNTLGGKWASVNPLYFAKGTTLTANDIAAYDFSKNAWNSAATRVNLVENSSLYRIYLNRSWCPGCAWDGQTVINPCPGSGCTYTSVATYLNGAITDSYGTNQRISVAAHEIGHAVGLAHASGAVLMNGATCGWLSRYCGYNVYIPQADDRNGVWSIYP